MVLATVGAASLSFAQDPVRSEFRGRSFNVYQFEYFPPHDGEQSTNTSQVVVLPFEKCCRQIDLERALEALARTSLSEATVVASSPDGSWFCPLEDIQRNLAAVEAAVVVVGSPVVNVLRLLLLVHVHEEPIGSALGSPLMLMATQPDLEAMAAAAATTAPGHPMVISSRAIPVRSFMTRWEHFLIFPMTVLGALFTFGLALLRFKDHRFAAVRTNEGCVVCLVSLLIGAFAFITAVGSISGSYMAASDMATGRIASLMYVTKNFVCLNLMSRVIVALFFEESVKAFVEFRPPESIYQTRRKEIAAAGLCIFGPLAVIIPK